MRTTKVKLGDLELTLGMSFGVLDRITSDIVDPLKLADEGLKEHQASLDGRSYTPAIKFDFDAACRVFHVGQTGDTDLTTIKAAAFGAGAIVAREVALRYLTALVIPQNADKMKQGKASDGAAPGE